MINPFSVFSQTEIAAAINIIPNSYGRLGQLNLMPVQGVPTSSIAIEEVNGSLAMLPTNLSGGPGVVGSTGKRVVRTFTIPKVEYNEHANPLEIQNVRGLGTNELMNMAQLLNQKLTTARGKHDITLEHLRMGALKGIIYDADGSSVIANLYTEFGISQKSVDFLLGTGTTEVRDKCYEVVRHVEDNLKGEVSNGVHALVSPEFFDKLIKHAKVKEAYASYQEAAQRLGGDVRKGFTFGGITFEEYRASATGSAGSTVRFIASGEGHAFPTGTVNTFSTFVGPADFNEAINTLGQTYYAKVEASKFDRGYDIHTQMNPLPMCKRPGVLVKLTSST